jgi:hypothetical protein
MTMTTTMTQAHCSQKNKLPDARGDIDDNATMPGSSREGVGVSSGGSGGNSDYGCS